MNEKHKQLHQLESADLKVHLYNKMIIHRSFGSNGRFACKSRRY